jgi:hypothetical protein
MSLSSVAHGERQPYEQRDRIQPGEFQPAYIVLPSKKKWVQKSRIVSIIANVLKNKGLLGMDIYRCIYVFFSVHFALE